MIDKLILAEFACESEFYNSFADPADASAAQVLQVTSFFLR